MFDFEYILGVMLFILIGILIIQKNKYSARINLYGKKEFELNSKCSTFLKENEELNNKCSMELRNIKGLKELLDKEEKEKNEKIGGFETVEGKIKKELRIP